MHWYWRYGVSFIIVAIGSVVLFIAPFVGRSRYAPRFVRIALVLLGPIGVVWSSLGWYLLQHDTGGGHTDLPWARYWALDHIKSTVSGMAVGILALLCFSGGLLRRRWPQPPEAPNQALQRTAGRSDA